MTTNTTTAATTLADRARAAWAAQVHAQAERDEKSERFAREELFSSATTRLEWVTDTDAMSDIEWTLPATADCGHPFTTAAYGGLWWRYTEGYAARPPMAVALDACDVCGADRWRGVADLADLGRVLGRDDTDCDRCDAKAAEAALAPDQRAEIDAPTGRPAPADRELLDTALAAAQPTHTNTREDAQVDALTSIAHSLLILARDTVAARNEGRPR